MTLRIGYFPQNNSLWVLRHLGLLEQHVPDVEWVDFRTLENARVDPHSGLPSAHGDHLFDGGYDIIGTGSTPPVTAQAKNHDIVYLGISEPRIENGRLVVHADSAIHEPADLKGRSVGLGHGSWQTTLLLLALEKAGLRWSDIEPIDVYHDAGDRFSRREFDAWVGSYPYLSAVEAANDLRDVIATDGLFSHRSLWFTRRDVVEQRADDVTAVLTAIDDADRWIAANPTEAAELFAADDGRPVSEWVHALQTRPWGVRPVSAEFVEEQQHAADLFHANGLIERPVTVADAVSSELAATVETIAAR
ncbi:MAG: ABC transporter substrate-binding protein [Gordonia sp. (in: high G+C Gram-positive bacteria)]